MATPRKATLTVSWDKYGLSTSLDVETPAIPTLLSMTCKYLAGFGNWWPTVDHHNPMSSDPYTYSYELTFSDDIGSTNQEIIDLINSGDMTLTISTSNDSGGEYAITGILQVTDSVIYVTINDGKTGTYYPLWNTRIATVTVTLSYPKYNLSTTYSFRVPPFGLLCNGPSEAFFTLPTISNYDDYYYNVNDPIQLTINSSVSSYQQYFQEWIDYGILKATGFLNHLMDTTSSHYYNLFIQTTYGTEWNKYLKINSEFNTNYFDIDFDICDTWIDQNDFKNNFSTTLQIIPVKSAYGDCELVPYVYFNGQNLYAGHINENGYMIRNENDYSTTVASMVSTAAAAGLYYSCGAIFNDEYGGDYNIGQMTVQVLTPPELCTTMSSGMTFNRGNSAASDLYENVCFLMLRFNSAQLAQDFVNMTQAGFIYMTMTTNGSGSNIIRSTTAINDRPYNLHIPSTSRDRISPSCFFSSTSSARSGIPDGPKIYGSYYYAILFYTQYNEPQNTSSISQGVRLRFCNSLTGSSTQGSNPSYFYFYGNDVQQLYNIIGWEL